MGRTSRCVHCSPYLIFFMIIVTHFGIPVFLTKIFIVPGLLV